MKRGKNYKNSIKNLDKSTSYSLTDGVEKVKELSYSKFVGSLEIHVDLKLPKDKDPKSLKGAISLPNTTSQKDVKIAVFCTPEKEQEAKKAGADIVGLDNLIKDIKAGKIEFDVAIATPDVMPRIAILGKELGPKGLMPSPKNDTVTEDITSTVAEYKKGKQTFACDPSGVVHMSVGKLDLENEKLIENIHVAVEAIAEVIGKTPEFAIEKMHVAPTMGQSVKVTYSKE